MPKKRAQPAAAAAASLPKRKPGNLEDVASNAPCSVNAMFKTCYGKDNQIHLTGDTFPSYVEDDIWALLQEVGFEYKNKKGFCHDEMGIKGLDNEFDVRKTLVRDGVPPGMKELEEEDAEQAVALKKWIAFANVSLKDSDAKQAFEKIALPSDLEALQFLSKLGFAVDGDTQQIYRGSEEEFKSVAALRAFVRSADDEVLVTKGGDDIQSPRKRARRTTRKADMPLKDDELMALRLWAAVAPIQLPVYDKDDPTDFEAYGKEEEGQPSVTTSSARVPVSHVETKNTKAKTDDQSSADTSTLGEDPSHATKSNSSCIIL